MRIDPFAAEPNPAFYVPRKATEEALDALRAALTGGSRVVAISGPRGLGKRMVLRVLEDRLRDIFRCVHIGYAALAARDLCALSLGSLGLDPAGDAEATLVGASRSGRPLVLLLEDASALPAATSRRLRELTEEAQGGLRVVLRIPGERGRRVLEGFDDAVEVSLGEPMSPDETARFLSERLGHARAPEALRLRFHPEAVERLHREGEGVPSVVAALARQRSEGVAASEPSAESALPPDRPDPFGPGAGEEAYQPRPATEAVLETIESELRGGRTTLLLRGPAGMGKTTVLRVLAGRLREPFQPVEVPYAHLEPIEFWSYVLFQLGAPRSDEPDREVLEIAERLGRVGGLLVLLIDEAQALSPETRASLADLMQRSEGRLRAVLAHPPETPAANWAELPDALEVALDAPLEPEEADAYVQGRLERYDAPPAVTRRFDDSTLASLFRASRGNPRELNRLAGQVERGEPAPLATLAQATPAAAVPRAEAPLSEPAREAPTPSAASREVASARPSAPRQRRIQRRARRARLPEELLSVLPHVALGAGTPLALLGLWLWLGPVFVPDSARVAPVAPPEVHVHVNADPWAHVWVDGRALGTTPIGNVPLVPGEHVFRAQLPDGRIVERQIRVDDLHRHVALP